MRVYSHQLQVISYKAKGKRQKVKSQFKIKNFEFLILVLPFAFLLLILFPGCTKNVEIRNLGANGKNIICFGDSITFGYGANPGQDYPSLLAKMANAPVINAGIDGDTTIEALKRLDSDVLEKDHCLVIIEFGGNDFLRKVDKKVTLDNVREMIDRIQAKGAMVAIADISAGMILGEYKKEFYALAQEKGAIFIPSLLDGIITNSHLKSDFIHPNDKGYKIISQRIFQAILPYLGEKSTTIEKRQAQVSAEGGS